MDTSDPSSERPGGSPPCQAADADPAYMGMLDRTEVLELLNLLLESERAGSKAVAAFRKEASPAAQATLADVGRDEARYCAMLERWIRQLDGRPSTATGRFYQQAIAIEGEKDRLAFLNRGQAWVMRRLAENLARIPDDKLHADLREMHERHGENITRCEALLQP